MRKGAGFLGRNRFKKEEAPKLPDPESFTLEKKPEEATDVSPENPVNADIEADGVETNKTGVDEALEQDGGKQSEVDGVDEALGQTAVESDADIVEKIKTAKAEAVAKLPQENNAERRKVNEQRRLILIGCGAVAAIAVIAGVILYNVNTQRTGENVSLPEVENINSGTTSTQAVDLAKLRAEADRVLSENGLLAASMYYRAQIDRTKNPLQKYNPDENADENATEEETNAENAGADISVDTNIETGTNNGEGEAEDDGSESENSETSDNGYQYNIAKSESMSDRAAIWLSYAKFLNDYLHSEAANSLTTAPEDGSEYLVGVESREYWNDELLVAADMAEKTYPCKSTAEAYAQYLREYRSDDPFTADYYAESATIRTR